MKATCLLLMLAGSAFGAQTVLYVNPQSGRDDNNGSSAKPFASLEKARDTLRVMKKEGVFPKKGAEVELTGTFAMTGATFALDLNDGGTESNAPVVYKASKKGAVFIGGYVLPKSGFRTVTDSETLARLPDCARGNVLRFDLKSVGVRQLAALPDKFSGWNEMEVFSGGQAMRLARWPNTGWAEIAKVVDRGVKPIDHATGEWEFGYKGGTFEYAEDAPARWKVKRAFG